MLAAEFGSHDQLEWKNRFFLRITEAAITL